MYEIVVVQLHFNRLEYSKFCLNSYFENVKTPHKLILWDNGSLDGTAEFLKSVEADKGLLSTLPFEIEFRFSPTNVKWADVINLLWTENPEATYLGYCASDMRIMGDWLEMKKTFGLNDKISVVSDAISDRDRRDTQAPLSWDGSHSLVTRDRYGDAPTDCMPVLLRNDLYKKFGPMVEGGGMGAMIFYHGLLRKNGYLTGWYREENCFSQIMLSHPILSLEDTPKYRLYREWQHKYKRGLLGTGTPPSDMYKGVSIVV